jgi:outer membrane protein assembly factor BamA
MPFEKMYSPGGPNEVRAWSFYELGPGSYSPDSANNEKRLGDIKLVGNLEYRFKLFWVLEGAMFVDAGNTWTVYDRENQPGSTFKWNQFYKEFAIGGGLGIRLDFSFLLIRTDFGFKLRDPSIQEGSRWIELNQTKHYTFNDRFTFQFGIGYPF